MSEREECLKKCPAFGWDAEGSSGFDDSTDECRSCAEGDQKMHDACKAEALAGQAAAGRNKKKEEEAAAAAQAKADKKAKIDAYRNEVAAKVGGPTQSAEPSTAPETVAPTTTPKAKTKKAAQAKPPAVQGDSPIQIIVEILKRGEPRTALEMQDEIVRRRGCAKSTASLYTGECLRFGVLLGVVTKQGKTYRLGQ